MKSWNNPYNEGDEEYDHSAGATFVGLKQAAKFIGFVLFLMVLLAGYAFWTIVLSGQ